MVRWAVAIVVGQTLGTAAVLIVAGLILGVPPGRLGVAPHRGRGSQADARPTLRLSMPGLLAPFRPAASSPQNPVRTTKSGLLFLDNRRLLYAYVRFSNRPELARPGSAGMGGAAFVLQGAVIDVATGKLVARPEWPSKTPEAAVAAAETAGIVILTGNTLDQIGRDFRVQRILQLPAPASGKLTRPPHSAWNVASSRTGHTLLLWPAANQKWEDWMLIDAENLAVIRQFRAPPSTTAMAAAASDAHEVVTAPLEDESLLVSLQADGTWRRLWRAPAGCEIFETRFVAPHILFVGVEPAPPPGNRNPSCVPAFVDMEGTEAPQPSAAAAVGPAVNEGARLAIVRTSLQGFSGWLDLAGHTVIRGFTVYDNPPERPGLLLRARGSELKNPSSFALSPDGSRLAILGEGENIELYDLPPGPVR